MIKRLEEKIGCPLFKRTKDGLVLTDTGRQLYTSASQTEKIWQDFYQNLNATDATRVSRLSFGITTQLGLKVLPDILCTFNRQFPNVSCNILDIRHRQLEQKLLDGEIDLAITHTYPNTELPSISYEPFLYDPFVVMAPLENSFENQPGIIISGSSGQEIDLSMLRNYKLILPLSGNQTRAIIDRALAEAGILTPAELFPNHQFQTIQGLVAGGMGIGIIPYSCLTPAYKVKIYRIPERYHAYWNLCIARKKGYPESYIEARFRDIAVNICTDILSRAPW